MKNPVFGSNVIQSFIDFETRKGKVRLGIETPLQRVFAETSEGKFYLSDPIGIKVPKLTVSPDTLADLNTVRIVEYGNDIDILTVITLINFIIGEVPAEEGSLVMGNIVASFPADPSVHVEDIYAFSLSLTLPGTEVNVDLGLGSVLGSGSYDLVSTADAASEDRITGQTVPTAPTGGAVAKVLIRAASEGISLNTAESIKEIFLNAAGVWNTDNNGNLLANGTIIIKWTKIV
jgi:hypothetical protein